MTTLATAPELIRDCTGRSLGSIQERLRKNRAELTAPLKEDQADWAELSAELHAIWDRCCWCGVEKAARGCGLLGVQLDHLIGGPRRRHDRRNVIPVCARYGGNPGCHFRVETHPEWALFLKSRHDPEYFDYEWLCKLAGKVLEFPVEPPGFYRSLTSRKD